MNTNRMKNLTPLLVLILSVPCFGWGRDGHKITGTIAMHYLTPEAKAGCTALLGDQSLADVSTWADEIRSDSAYRWASPLHYANVKPGEGAFDLKRDCPQRGCVVSAITKYTKVLRSKDASTGDKTEALKFLVHFVGDIHQPLHVSHAKDKGGNDIKVELFHDRTNLHRVWDSGLIRRTKKGWTEYAAELQQAVTDKQLDDWKSTNPVEWATESYKLALSHAYVIPKDGQVGQDYFERCIPVVDERLAMAGIRMATLLNEIFEEGAGVVAPAEATKPRAPSTAAAFVGRMGCATCIFDMKGVEGCKLAVEFDGKHYLVVGSDIDDHGDAHAPDGLCNTARRASFKGEFQGNRFLATEFRLLP